MEEQSVSAQVKKGELLAQVLPYLLFWLFVVALFGLIATPMAKVCIFDGVYESIGSFYNNEEIALFIPELHGMIVGVRTVTAIAFGLLIVSLIFFITDAYKVFDIIMTALYLAFIAIGIAGVATVNIMDEGSDTINAGALFIIFIVVPSVLTLINVVSLMYDGSRRSNNDTLFYATHEVPAKPYHYDYPYDEDEKRAWIRYKYEKRVYDNKINREIPETLVFVDKYFAPIFIILGIISLVGIIVVCAI